MKTTDLKVRLAFEDEVLGTSSNNPEIHDEFIASKAPDAKSREEEIAAIGVAEAVEKSMTVFPKMADGTPFIWDYQIRGFLKEAISALKKADDSECYNLKAHKKEVDGLIFIFPRRIAIDMHGMMMGTCQRPLRAATAQGERISLACSETVPEGSTIEFTIKCLNSNDIKYVKECLEYGMFKGLLQWRNSGKGRFTYEILEESEPPIKKSAAKTKKAAKKSEDQSE